MFNYSFWSLCEALANWAIFWVDTFIVGSMFSEYQLGLYKNSTNMVQSIMGMLSASMSPVLLSALSRLKNSKRILRRVSQYLSSDTLSCAADGAGLFLIQGDRDPSSVRKPVVGGGQYRGCMGADDAVQCDVLQSSG